jgi:hypothetical protein
VLPCSFATGFADLVALRADELGADFDQLAAADRAGRLAGFFFDVLFGLWIHIS